MSNGTDVAPDGSPVAFYTHIPANGEPELIHEALPPGASIPEVRYEIDGREWRQPFTARLLDEAALRDLLGGAGLRFTGWLDRPGWFTAVPVAPLSDRGR